MNQINNKNINVLWSARAWYPQYAAWPDSVILEFISQKFAKLYARLIEVNEFNEPFLFNIVFVPIMLTLFLGKSKLCMGCQCHQIFAAPLISELWPCSSLFVYSLNAFKNSTFQTFIYVCITILNIHNSLSSSLISTFNRGIHLLSKIVFF